MITIDAARAIGREADLGSLEVGKLADITTIKMTSPHLMPRLMPIHQLMLYGNPGDVADVFVAGRALMRPQGAHGLGSGRLRVRGNGKSRGDTPCGI